MADLPAPESPQFPRLGSYQIIRPLGSGGMSNVFQAIHQDTGSLVALKVLPRKLAQNPVLLQRFLKEAKSAEALDHPNIVAIYDRGNDGGRHYLVLEFVDGRDLFDHVRSMGPLTSEATIRLTREVAAGLRYASQLGMIHRDIKPANLLLTTHGVAKIIDLGLALQTIEEDERVTRQGTTVGTVDYMSPEQARDSRRINEASDIYSLGCTLFFLVTGTPPYPGRTLADKLARHHSAEIPNARDRNPAIAADLAALIHQMMAKSPKDRPEGYDDLLDQLERIDRGEPRILASDTLDVLIDDEDDSGDAIVLTIAAPAAPPVPPTSPPVSADLRRTEKPKPPSQPDFSIAELAALDSDEVRPSRRKRSRELTPPAVQAALLEASEIAIESPTIRRPGDELPLQTWIVAGLFVGLAIALVGVGLSFLISSLRPEPSPDPNESASTTGVPSSYVAENTTSISDTEPVADSRPIDRTPLSVPPQRPANPTSGATRPDPSLASALPTPAITSQIMDRFGFPADHGTTPDDETNPVVVRRFDEAGEQVTDSLASALVRPTSLVEIADAGPVREDHFEMTGKSKVIRGREGYHPILRIDSGSSPLNRAETAKIMLGGGGVERLTLQNLDIVVDLRDLPVNLTSLIQCQGVDLELIQCSITIHNSADRTGFSLIRTSNGPRRNRIRFDRCLVRGPVSTLVDVGSDQCELDLRRSVVVGAGSSLFQYDSTNKTDRSLRMLHSVLISSGSLIATTSRSERLTWRSLGSVFIHCDPIGPGPWLSTSGSPPKETANAIDYDGGANRWIGWSSPPGLVSAPTEGEANSLANQLTGPQQTWMDRREDKPWPLVFLNEKVSAANVQSALGNGQPDLMNVAIPTPSLYQETVDRFPRLLFAEGAGEGARVAAVDPRPLVNLTFDLRSSPEDLGVFLTRQLTDPAKRYEVHVSGSGIHPMTPVRLPDKVAATVIGTAATSSLAGMLQITPNQPAEAIFVVGRSDLSLQNLALLIDETKPEVAAVTVDGGTFAARHCSFRSRGEEVLNAASLVRVRAAGPARDRPVLSLENCWMWTNRSAIALDLLRATCLVKNSVILAGRTAIQIRTPDGPWSAPDLLADLSLENSTILAERIAIEAAELGSPTVQPDRPFLVWSRACVFPRSWRDQGALLAVDRERFARASLFWDSANDIYDVSRLLGDARIEAVSGPSADLRRQWIEVWGGNHARLDRGPDPRKADRLLFFHDASRSRTSRPTLSQLELDSVKHRGQGASFKDLPPIPRS